MILVPLWEQMITLSSIENTHDISQSALYWGWGIFIQVQFFNLFSHLKLVWTYSIQHMYDDKYAGASKMAHAVKALSPSQKLQHWSRTDNIQLVQGKKSLRNSILSVGSLIHPVIHIYYHQPDRVVLVPVHSSCSRCPWLFFLEGSWHWTLDALEYSGYRQFINHWLPLILSN